VVLQGIGAGLNGSKLTSAVAILSAVWVASGCVSRTSGRKYWKLRWQLLTILIDIGF
jgi:hypothetical protein